MQRIIRIPDGEEAFGDVVEGAAGRLKTFGEGLENSLQMIAAGKLMFARHAVLGAAQFLVVAQAGEAAGLGAVADALGKNAGEKKGMVADVSADQEAGSFIGRLKCGEHLEEIIERKALAGDGAFGTAGFGKRGEDFRDVVGEVAVLEVRALKNVANQNVKIEAGGNREAAAMFEQGVEKRGVVKNLVTGTFIGEKFDETIHGSEPTAQHGQNEVHIRCRELNPAIGLDHLHRHFTSSAFDAAPPMPALRPRPTATRFTDSIISSKKRRRWQWLNEEMRCCNLQYASGLRCKLK
jgi:hypothetical protein